ncbi:hypothetical protein PR202_ga14732 [Eleusine coracana subsp. coracana]|uniref:Uncharacterized protein n=1 Tax=Eleusine coracana subsp. coracana TaxID=191504 RepID=A0AAV5CI98_ELECO|nr:hypothetical protein PR202_ga14732 [Eleusine coracana subsp. coracana]
MTLKSSRCSEEIYREPPVCLKKEFKSSVIKIVDSSWSSLSANSICSDPASEDNFHLTKRRKMDEEYNSLLVNGNTRETTTRNFELLDVTLLHHRTVQILEQILSDIMENEDQFVEESELDPSKTTMMGDKKSNVGNWIQCREVLDTGVVCGKWRR